MVRAQPAEAQPLGPVAVGTAPGAAAFLLSAGSAPLLPGGLRRVATMLTVLGLAMVPWLVVLHTGLPATARASHWAWTWTGLDSLEAIGLFSTGLLLKRGDRRSCLTAAATSALLLVDAWFDTMTAAPGTDLASALLMAAIAEVPLAAACAVLAIRTFPASRTPDGGPVDARCRRPLQPAGLLQWRDGTASPMVGEGAHRGT